MPILEKKNPLLFFSSYLYFFPSFDSLDSQSVDQKKNNNNKHNCV